MPPPFPPNDSFNPPTSRNNKVLHNGTPIRDARQLCGRALAPRKRRVHDVAEHATRVALRAVRHVADGGGAGSGVGGVGGGCRGGARGNVLILVGAGEEGVGSFGGVVGDFSPVSLRWFL